MQRPDSGPPEWPPAARDDSSHGQQTESSQYEDKLTLLNLSSSHVLAEIETRIDSTSSVNEAPLHSQPKPSPDTATISHDYPRAASAVAGLHDVQATSQSSAQNNGQPFNGSTEPQAQAHGHVLSDIELESTMHAVRLAEDLLNNFSEDILLASPTPNASMTSSPRRITASMESLSISPIPPTLDQEAPLDPIHSVAVPTSSPPRVFGQSLPDQGQPSSASPTALTFAEAARKVIDAMPSPADAQPFAPASLYEEPPTPSTQSQTTTSAPLPWSTPAVRRARRSLKRRAPLQIVSSPRNPDQPPQLPRETPDGYHHYLCNLHPWAHLVRPRSYRTLCESPSLILSYLDPSRYRHPPPSAYLSSKFTKTLFPQMFLRRDRPPAAIPLIELQHLEDTIAFRQRSQHVIDDLIAGTYEDVDTSSFPRTSAGSHPTLLTPPIVRGRRPVLYQVVATGWPTGVILEAKDFLTVGPDRRDLHCVILDFYALSVQSSSRGFDKTQVSVKDFVWVYDVKPSPQAFRFPEGALRHSRIPRTTALDNNSIYYFRVAEFAFVTPPDSVDPVFGIVMQRTVRANKVTHLRIVFESAPEAVSITESISDFKLAQAREDEIVLADSRRNVSSAMRFSEPPVSIEARNHLCRHAAQFLPMHPEEGLIPLRVYRLDGDHRRWIKDRSERFDSFHTDRPLAARRMQRLFNVACAALATLNTIAEDRRTHWVTAFTEHPRQNPIRLTFQLAHMPSEAGWSSHSRVVIWIPDSNLLTRARVHSAHFNTDDRSMDITIEAFSWSHQTISRALRESGRTVGSFTVLDLCIRMMGSSASSNPTFDCIARMDLSKDVSGTTAERVVDLLYGTAPLGCLERKDIHPAPEQFERGTWSVTINNKPFHPTAEQIAAVRLGTTTRFPLVGIQAAFGTGKTVTGAIIAAALAQNPEDIIVITAVTNAAVAQFAETLLSLDACANLTLLRFLSDTADFENAHPTSVDLSVILRELIHTHGHDMSEGERNQCQTFCMYRARIERSRNLEDAPGLDEDQMEEYTISETLASETLQKMVALMLRVRRPRILCLTVASLLNSTRDSDGLFAGVRTRFTNLIGDEASQIPEPALLAIAVRLPHIRHIYIGDVHQLEPHAKCSRLSNPARFGARGVMSLLASGRAIPVVPLATTFRAHPALNDLPAQIAYDGALVSGTAAEHRQMLLSILRFPNPALPFLFVDVHGSSYRAPSMSHYNETEADLCFKLVGSLISKGIVPADICIITFYREQYRRIQGRSRELGVELTTVDSVQGREMQVVILLTTRTNIDPASADFLDDCRRINVALTRCRHGQFLLGNIRSLSPIPVWGNVIAWARQHHAVVQSRELLRILDMP